MFEYFQPFRKTELTMSTIITLTERGKELAEQNTNSDSGLSAIISIMGFNDGTISMQELSERTGIPFDRIKSLVNNSRAYIHVDNNNK
jgi:hypothetical protein